MTLALLVGSIDYTENDRWVLFDAYEQPAEGKWAVDVLFADAILLNDGAVPLLHVPGHLELRQIIDGRLNLCGRPERRGRRYEIYV